MKNNPKTTFSQVFSDRNDRNAIVVFCVLVVVGIVFAFRSWQLDIPLRVYSTLFCSFCTGYAAWLIYHNGGSKFAHALGMFGFIVAVAVATYSGGGISSEAIGWLLLVPLIGGLSGGVNAAVFGSITAGLAGFLLLVLEVYGGQPNDLTPVSDRFVQGRVHQVGQFAVLIIMTTEFLRQLKKADLALKLQYHQIEEEVGLRKNAEAAEKTANAAKTQFLSNMSHELRTPLNGVLGVLDVLARGQMTSKQLSLIELGKNSSELLLGLISNILDMSKIETGKMHLERTNFGLAELFFEIESEALIACREKALNCVFTQDFCADSIYGDRARIKQLLNNIIQNAIKFTAAGEIKVEAMLLKSSVNGDDYFGFYCDVTDTGIGIAEAEISALFEPFYQSETSDTRRFGGAGLGLSISQRLVTLMNGKLDVVSEFESGSRFSVFLPLGSGTASQVSDNTVP